MSKFEYLPKQNQFRNKETGRFADGLSAIKAGDIQQVDTPTGKRFKLKGGSFVSKDSLIRSTSKEELYAGLEGEANIFIDENGDVRVIETYGPNLEQRDRNLIADGIVNDIIKESEYQEAGSIAESADLIRERSIINYETIR